MTITSVRRALFANTNHPTAMSKIPALAILLTGIVLLIFGFNAADSVSSSISNAVNGTPTDRSIWLIVLGVIATLTGGVGLLFRRG